MFEFLKKTFILKVFTKKRIFLLCGLAILVLLIFPLKSALAQWYNPATWIPSIIGLVIKLILKISELILQLANWILKVAISNPFGVPLTTPGQAPLGNPIILIGWTLLRDIVNMFFVLGLAYIGLATALNLTTFDTKKAFKNLLLVALLINFTPVICGVIVDIANIISAFFLQGIDFSALQDIFGRQQGEISRSLGSFSMDNAMVMLKSLFLIAYGFLAAFVLTLYAALFFIRAPIIWMLVIFSPLAFFASIFEKTKQYFKQWWDIFLQWSIIVIPSAFFLYLSQQVLVNSKDLVKIPDSGLMGKLLSEIAPYGVALFFLIIGLIATMKINAMGAKATMSGTKTLLKKTGKGGAKAAKWSGKKAKQIGKGATAGVSGAAVGFREGFKQRTTAKSGSSRREKVGTFMRNMRRTTQAMGEGALTKEGREEGRKRVAKSLEKRHLRKAGSYEVGRKKRWAIDDEAQKRLEGMSTEDQQTLLKRSAITDQAKKERAAVTAILSKKGEFEVKDKDGNIDQAKEEKMVQEAQKLGVDISNLAKSRPDLTPIIKAAKVEQQMMEDLAKKVEKLKNHYMSTAGGSLDEKTAGKQAKRETQKKDRTRDDKIMRSRMAHYQSTSPEMVPEEVEFRAKQDLQKMKRRKVESKLIQREVGRMTGREFAKNVTSKASLQNADVIAGLDAGKLRDFSRLASQTQRRSLGDAVDTKVAETAHVRQELGRQGVSLWSTGKNQEALNLMNLISSIQTDANFH